LTDTNIEMKKYHELIISELKEIVKESVDEAFAREQKRQM